MPLPDLVVSKGADVAGLLATADKDGDESHWYINFASAYEINLWYQVQPRTIAMGGYWDFQWVVGINPRLCQSLKQKRPGGTRGEEKERHGKFRTGVLMMDFPEMVPDLITTVIETNYDRKRRKTRWREPVHLMALFLLLVFVLGSVLVLVHGPVEGMWCPPMFHACAVRGRPWPESVR